jgi:hypothetical protein
LMLLRPNCWRTSNWFSSLRSTPHWLATKPAIVQPGLVHVLVTVLV